MSTLSASIPLLAMAELRASTTSAALTRPSAAMRSPTPRSRAVKSSSAGAFLPQAAGEPPSSPCAAASSRAEASSSAVLPSARPRSPKPSSRPAQPRGGLAVAEPVADPQQFGIHRREGRFQPVAQGAEGRRAQLHRRTSAISAGMRSSGHDAAGGAERDRLLRHAEHHAALLVLRQRRGAGLPHLEQPARAVVAPCRS
jgi:hypothetical protein